MLSVQPNHAQSFNNSLYKHPSDVTYASNYFFLAELRRGHALFVDGRSLQESAAAARDASVMCGDQERLPECSIRPKLDR